jgi:hypothetical protein
MTLEDAIVIANVLLFRVYGADGLRLGWFFL